MRGAFVVAVLGAVPAGALAGVTLALGVADHLDPCLRWGHASGPLVPPSEGRCAGYAGATSQTRLQQAVWLVVIQGVILAAVALGLSGAWRGSTRRILAAVALLVVESVPLALGGMFVFTLLSALLFALSAWMTARARHVAAPGPS